MSCADSEKRKYQQFRERWRERERARKDIVEKRQPEQRRPSH